VALTLLCMALTGDGYYFYTPMSQWHRVIPRTRALFAQLRELTGERTEHVRVSHAYGKTIGLLHLPPGFESAPPKSLPALVGLHPLGGDKDSYDAFLSLFREAGYATLCVDLPAHGENFDGPRLRHNSEWVGVAALEFLAEHPAIDPGRLGVLGGSLGAFFAQRTAAASPLAKACLVYASPFDLGARMECVPPGVIEAFAWAVGASSVGELYAQAQRFHLRDVIEKIKCPLCLVHGTQDHVCDFTASYEIASRAQAPITVQPLIGLDHEAAYPGIAQIAEPGITWLKQTL
jgi:dipeptidyl aminopeptidase/acylaminoacyl peptidase